MGGRRSKRIIAPAIKSMQVAWSAPGRSSQDLSIKVAFLCSAPSYPTQSRRHKYVIEIDSRNNDLTPVDK